MTKISLKPLKRGIGLFPKTAIPDGYLPKKYGDIEGGTLNISADFKIE